MSKNKDYGLIKSIILNASNYLEYPLLIKNGIISPSNKDVELFITSNFVKEISLL